MKDPRLNTWEIEDDYTIVDQSGPIAKVFEPEDFPCLGPHDIEKAEAYFKSVAKLMKSAPSLLAALERMLMLHEKTMKEANHKESFYSAETMREMNEAPIQAQKAIAEAKTV